MHILGWFNIICLLCAFRLSRSNIGDKGYIEEWNTSFQIFSNSINLDAHIRPGNN